MQRFFGFAVLVLFALLLLTGLLDWMGGCGESFVYADGSRHLGECIGRDTFQSIILEIFKWIHANNG